MGGKIRNLIAFGETKTTAEWSRDPRCAVTGVTLRKRLDSGNWTPEEAITTHSGQRPRNQLQLNIESEIRACVEAGATSSNNIAVQLGCHWRTIKRHLSRMEDGEKLRDRIEDNRGPGKGRPKNVAAYITAFGETKRIFEWIIDPRCVVSRRTLTLRLKTGNWTPEEAITAPPMPRRERNVKRGEATRTPATVVEALEATLLANAQRGTS